MPSTRPSSAHTRDPVSSWSTELPPGVDPRPSSHAASTHDGPASESPERKPRAARGVAVLALQARALRQARFTGAAGAVADELARSLRCERVSIGFMQRGRMRVCALSNTADVDERQPVVRAVARAMEEAARQQAMVMHPLPPGTARLAYGAHAALSAINGRLAVYTVPLYSLDHAGDEAQAVGAMLFEKADGFDRRTAAAAQDAASFVGPVLALQHRLDQPVSGRWLDMVKPRHAGPWGLGRAQWLGVAAAGVLLAAALWPGTFRVVAPARVEGTGQQVLAAPQDGFVASAALRPGAQIKAGQVLLTLEDKDLALDVAKWQAELAQLDKKYREAQTSDDAAAIVVARAKLEQAQAQLELVNQQLERTRLKAPFDGVLLSGDFTQAVGAPVKRGQELLTVAPDRKVRIVAEVDEQDIGQLREQQSAQVLFGAFAREALKLEITRIAPLATVVDGRNVFEVDARLLEPARTATLLPGLRGVVRIDIEPQLQGWIWWHRASAWARRQAWRLLG